MFGPRETMTALFYLAILFLCQSNAILSENNEEKSGMDFPDAKKVMASLNRTYMFQSLIKSPKLQCVYQVFYDRKVPGYGLKPKYDKVSLFKDGGFLNNPLYVRNVVNSTIYLSSNPAFSNNPTELEILFSDLESCMVTKGPNIRDFPRACRLWLTSSSFSSPSPLCTQAFTRHCKFPPYIYNITGCTNLNKHY
uniref:Putative 25 kDa salivary gland protein family member n=1 Tax=Ixodes ricinus TaxID=34613 RepID=A0A090XCD8_IXORI